MTTFALKTYGVQLSDFSPRMLSVVGTDWGFFGVGTYWGFFEPLKFAESLFRPYLAQFSSSERLFRDPPSFIRRKSDSRKSATHLAGILRYGLSAEAQAFEIL